MPYAEVIFEPGSHSVIQYDNEEELDGFLKEHHRRALAGEDGGPTGHPAERITKILLYDNHPADYPASVNAASLNDLVSGMAKENELDGNQLISAVRDEMSPIYPISQGRHESIFKMDGAEKSLDFLAGDNDAA